MSSIAGFFHPFYDFTVDTKLTSGISDSMLSSLAHRGPDDKNCLVTPPGVLLHTALFLTPNTPRQPSRGQGNLRHLSITYDGSIINMPELKSTLRSRSISTKDLTDCEVLLYLFYLYGIKFARLLRGGYAICILDEFHHRLYLFRDPMGVKPLFFYQAQGTLVFASEPKGILAYPGIEPKVDLNGLNEIFSLGPARTPGCGIYKDMLEVKPGHVVAYSKEGYSDITFWKLESQVHRESYEDTVAHISFLLKDIIHRQMSSGNICSFLSGGLDSSIVTALVNHELKNTSTNCPNDNDNNCAMPRHFHGPWTYIPVECYFGKISYNLFIWKTMYRMLIKIPARKFSSWPRILLITAFTADSLY